MNIELGRVGWRLSLQGMTGAEARAVRRALRLLAVHAPDHFSHLVGEIDVIEIGSRGCGPGAIACTGGFLGRRIRLAVSPSQMSLIELAVVLSHEGRHHYTDAQGQQWLIEHTCDDCTDPWERANDVIYQEDQRLRHRLYSIAQRRRSVGPTAGLAAAFGIALLGIIAADQLSR